MSKILVSVYMPAVERDFDVQIPYELKVHQTTELLRLLLKNEDAYGGVSVVDAVLCERDSGIPLDINRDAQELGLENGSRLLFI